MYIHICITIAADQTRDHVKDLKRVNPLHFLPPANG